MNRQEELDITSDVYKQWTDKYATTPGFDPNDPTLEQSDDYYNLIKTALGQVGRGKFAESVATMSEADMEILKKLSIYDPSFNPFAE